MNYIYRIFTNFVIFLKKKEIFSINIIIKLFNYFRKFIQFNSLKRISDYEFKKFSNTTFFNVFET